MASVPRLSVRGLSKAFYHTQALREVDLDVGVGEVVALVGENGAGKSTLAKIVAGIHRPDAGELYFEGQPVVVDSVLTARRLGIAVVHQELNLVPHLSVAHNLFLGREPVSGPVRLLRRADLRRQAMAVIGAVGLQVSPETLVRDLPLAQRQLVEIGRALSEDARLLIFDEPTSSLTETDAAELLRKIRELRDRGLSVLYISHRLDEVLGVADRVVVLRDGQKVREVQAAGATKLELMSMMVGRDIDTMYPKKVVQLGPVVLEVRGLLAHGLTEPVSFSVRAGEIFGIAGLVGSGRSELLRAIFGAEARASGEVFVMGRRLQARTPWAAVGMGVAMVPEDRKLQGLLLGMSVVDNVALSVLRRLAAGGLVRRRKAEAAVGAEYSQRVGVRAASLDQPVRMLSGGNQQKVLLAKWLASEPKVLLLDEPTRGIDVGAKHDIYQTICDLAARGVAIVMVSSEMEELIGLCDRVLVMRAGKPAGFLEREQLSEQAIMELAAQ
ncbi:MAG: sugar ABC transporter ATP-binding protein [Armatimonadetes bacterium]|nr:sugar ABC transporter ATP-binding protein [Armatimonadota bacterium]